MRSEAVCLFADLFAKQAEGAAAAATETSRARQKEAARERESGPRTLR